MSERRRQRVVIPGGGFIGESKIEILRGLAAAAHTAREHAARARLKHSLKPPEL